MARVLTEEQEARKKEYQREYYKAYRIKNAEALKAKRQEFRRLNPDVVREWKARDYQKHRDKRLATIRRYRESDPNRTKRRRAEEYKKNYDRYKAQAKRWKSKNQERVVELRKLYRHRRNELRRGRYSTDIRYKIESSLRSRISHAIRTGKTKKSARTLALTGCSIDELMQHLEKKFVPGMNWDNYGEWHIDHIRPCASFDLADREQQRQCFHYSNLQPLWAIDNFRKHDSWSPPAQPISNETTETTNTTETKETNSDSSQRPRRDDGGLDGQEGGIV